MADDWAIETTELRRRYDSMGRIGRRAIRFFATLIVAVAAFSLGCDGGGGAGSQSQSSQELAATPAPISTAAAPEANAPFWCDQVMALVIEDRREEAMSLLLDGTPPQQEINVPEFFALSEAEFVNLPKDTVSKLQTVIPGMLDQILTFAKAARASVAGTTDSAQKSSRASRLSEFGRNLALAERLAALQVIGNTISRWNLEN